MGKKLDDASERNYRDLYENAPDLFVIVDLESRIIVDCNRASGTMLGYEKGELVGKPMSILYPTREPSQHRPSAATPHDSAELADVERTLRRKDGSLVEASLTLRALRDEEGRITGAFATFRDITRRKQSDRDGAFLLRLASVLQRATTFEQVYRTVSGELGVYLGAERVAFVSIDADGVHGTMHRGYTSDGRLLPSRVELASLADAFVADHVREGRRTESLVVVQAQPRPWEERERTLARLVADRAWQWVEHLRVLAQLRDREVAAAIARTEERFGVLLESVKDYAVFMLDAHGRVATWNTGAERLKQYTRGEAVGQPYAIFFPAEDAENGRPREILDRAARDGRYEEEGWRVRKDGSRFWSESVVTAIRGADGTLEGFAKISRDVSDRRRKADELAGKQKELLRSLREREVLLQEVHHRVKNNLQVISSLINMQARRLEPGRARAALEECRSRVMTIALIHQNLNQSKEYGRVQFSDYVRILTSNVLRATGLSPTAVTLDVDIDEIPIGIDRALPCGLIVNELITNAMKHAFEDRRGRLRVELKAVNEDEIRLLVADDGVGLPADFEVRKSRSLGMQLIATLVDQLGGKLVVTSKGGTAFAITFASDEALDAEVKTGVLPRPSSDRGVSAGA